jgi:hypothetical protein
MSAANAAARKRRTTPDPAPPGANRQMPQQAAQPPAAGLTLQQVISLIDSRLVKLEVFMKDSKTAGAPSGVVNKELEITGNDIMLQEFDRRFELLAEEISNLKDALLKLQTYTMDVNKTLMEERVRVFSDLGGGIGDSEPTFSQNIFQDATTTAADLRDLAESELNSS